MTTMVVVVVIASSSSIHNCRALNVKELFLIRTETVSAFLFSTVSTTLCLDSNFLLRHSKLTSRKHTAQQTVHHMDAAFIAFISQLFFGSSSCWRAVCMCPSVYACDINSYAIAASPLRTLCEIAFWWLDNKLEFMFSFNQNSV